MPEGQIIVSFQLNQEEGETLIRLAREAVDQFLKEKRTLHTPRDISDKLRQLCGVFVTISNFENGRKELRGCIGFPYPNNPLAQAVIQSAISAATEDPRFCSLSHDELEKVVFEVSVLSPPQLLDAGEPKEYPRKIKVGEDGLIIERGIFKGLLLPQVPVEWDWDEEQFLCQCCLKASLPPDCWLLESTKVYKFQAVVFEEETPKGRVKRKTLGRN